MNTRIRVGSLALTALAAAVVPLTAAAGPASAASAAAPAGSAPAASAPAASASGPSAENVLTCATGTDGRTGGAACTNNTNQTVAFRATVVCGYWADQVGPWKTLNPGQRAESSATCDGGTGVGSVSWEEG